MPLVIVAVAPVVVVICRVALLRSALLRTLNVITLSALDTFCMVSVRLKNAFSGLGQCTVTLSMSHSELSGSSLKHEVSIVPHVAHNVKAIV